MKKIISIDPGGDGGFAVFINGTLQEVHTVPKVKSKVDYRELSKMVTEILQDTDMGIVEEVHAIFGSSAKSNFSFGFINGFVLGIINGMGVPYIMVNPKKWQKDVWVTQDKIFKTGKKVDTKATSVMAAKRLFPHTDFRKSSRARKFHDGLVDATLIGFWYLNLKK